MTDCVIPTNFEALHPDEIVKMDDDKDSKDSKDSKPRTDSSEKLCFFYTLEIHSKSTCSNFIQGQVKYNINLSELIKRPECLHNEVVYEWKLKNDGWANNYTSVRSREIFDCHLIKYIETIDGIDFDIKILFMSLKRGELLIPSVIKSDNQIISIIRNHIMISNNLHSTSTFHGTVYHNYRLEILCKEISLGNLMDLRYQGHPACKTPLYTYQRDSIQWAINMEREQPLIEFTEDKLFDLGNVLKLYFNYTKSGKDDCFIRYGELPKVQIKGGIIADEVGLGKTVQALSLTLSNPNIHTLIVVPNHLKTHWMNEMSKHFIGDPFTGIVLVVTVNEYSTMSDLELTYFKRIICDELAELYAMARAENHKLFKRLCCSDNFQYRWGITATPFVDDGALYNIIKFLSGNNKIINQNVGNHIIVQEAFKPFFRKNIKANVQCEISLPEVSIHNIGLKLSDYERAILDAMESDMTYSIDERLKIISNAMLDLSNNDKTVITVDELKQLTVQRFLEKINSAKENIKHLETSLENVLNKIAELKEYEISMESPMETIDTEIRKRISQSSKELSNISILIKELKDRENHLSIEIKIAQQILERRQTVHDNYLRITQTIEDILTKKQAVEQHAHEGLADNDMETDIDEDIDEDKMCPICYKGFTNRIVMFVKCRHYFCQLCFEQCHRDRPNTCPMCRSIAEIGEINYIGTDSKKITSTKNTEILRLLHSKPSNRFLIFTRFDKFITPLANFLATNDIVCKTFDEFQTSNPAIRDATRVIMLSANINASGTDMSYIHNVIIVEPFSNYVYGKEIEKQLIGRVHRINQIHEVDVYRLYIKNTIEEDIYSLG
jgi:hypothetical protein